MAASHFLKQNNQAVGTYKHTVLYRNAIKILWNHNWTLLGH